jgi:hypothetical protein
MNLLSLIIELIAGAIGGQVAGRALKEKGLGAAGNAIVDAAASAASCRASLSLARRRRCWRRAAASTSAR